MNRSLIAIGLVAAAIAWFGATDRPGGWNDGSRFATVESLVDHDTWAIDKSIFCTGAPYDPGAVPNGTLDKLYIDGHYYSDKSPVPAILMAGPYWVWRQCGGPTAGDNPKLFCLWLTLLSSGLAYVVTVVAMSAVAQRHLSDGMHLLVAVSLGLATIALPYARVVNNHILLLAVTAVILFLVDQIADAKRRWILALPLGSAAGLAYTIDLGAGPLVAFGTGLLFVWRSRSFAHIVLFGLSALPWVALHHGINYAIAGTIGPANAHPEFFHWPGCPFDATNLTGSWRHRHVSNFALYALDMLVGKRGFLGHDLALYLAIPAAVILLRHKQFPRKAEVILCTFWCVSIWLLYGATSNNYSGECCSVRWFVPLVAPGYFILIQYLKVFPHGLVAFTLLSAFGAVIAMQAWWRGPWTGQMVPGYWFLVAGAAILWCSTSWRNKNTTTQEEHQFRSAA